MSRRGSAAVLALVVTGTLAGIGLASGAALTLTHKAATAYKACVITGVTNNLAVIDAWVPESGAGQAGGNLSVLAAKNNNRRSYIRFDLSKCNPAVPASATVVTATLRLNAVAQVGRSIEAHRVTETWTENGISGGKGEPDAAASPTATVLVNTTGAYFEWDVRPDVASFIADQSSNHGWRLRDSVEVKSGSFQTVLASSENTDSATRPQLVVFYTS